MEVAAWMKTVQQTTSPKRRATPNSATQARCMRIAQHAARLAGLPYVAIATLDEVGQWRLKCQGLDSRPAIQSTSIFAEAALSDGPLVVENTLEDVHFAASPLVTGPSAVRFFAGAPLRNADHVVLGVLCVMGGEPRRLSKEESELLEDAAAMLVECMEQQGEHEREHAVLESIQETVFELDAEGRWTFLSPAWSALTGFSATESLGHPWDAFIHEEDRERACSELRRILNDGADTCRLKIRFVNAEGGFRWVLLRAIRHGDDRGRTVGVRGTLADVEDEQEGGTGRDRQVVELEYERTRLRYVFIHTPAFICILRGPNHAYEMANPAYLHLMGASDVQRRTVAEVVPESVRDEYVDLLDYVYQRGEPFVKAETPVHVPGASGDSGLRYVNWLYEPLRKADGTVTGVFVHGVDVTEQVLAREKAGQTSQAGLMLIDSLPEVVCTVDRDGRFAQVGAASIHVWGYDPEELAGRDVADVVFPEDVAYTLEAIEGCEASHSIGRFESRCLRKDGRVVQMHWSASWSDSDELLYVVAHLLTAQSTGEAVSQEPEDRNKLLIDNVRDHAIVMLDAAGCISSWNAGAEDVTGYGPEEVIGRDLDFFLPEEDRASGLPSLQQERALASGRSTERRWHIHKDGTRRRVEITTSPIWDESGSLKGYAEVWHDLTDQEHTDERSQPLETAVPELPGTVSLTDVGLDTSGDESRPRLLLVDGSRDVHASLYHMLGSVYDVVAVSTYDESVQQAYLAQYDVVLVDVNLSAAWSGLDVLRSLRQFESYRSTAIIACTANAQPGDADRFRTAGFDGCVAKPFQREELLNALQQQAAVYSW
ncbi:MAG TPA: PAS domain S-box protein [Rhodothermales bacterium]|nr:PAS domain S-box protein [Rhodothermales bacterium]